MNEAAASDRGKRPSTDSEIMMQARCWPKAEELGVPLARQIKCHPKQSHYQTRSAGCPTPAHSTQAGQCSVRPDPTTRKPRHTCRSGDGSCATRPRGRCRSLRARAIQASGPRSALHNTNEIKGSLHALAAQAMQQALITHTSAITNITTVFEIRPPPAA